MLSRTFIASRPLVARAAQMQTRSFSRAAVLRADLVQDLYLKEIKAYKPQPVKANDADAHVQKFAVPKPPKSPEESNLSSELGAYETQAVDIEGGASTEAGAAPVEEDWFQEEEETPAAGGH